MKYHLHWEKRRYLYEERDIEELQRKNILVMGIYIEKWLYKKDERYIEMKHRLITVSKKQFLY